MIKRIHEKPKIFKDLNKDNVLQSLKILSIGLVYLSILMFKIMYLVGKYCMKMCIAFAKSYEKYGDEKKTKKRFKKDGINTY